VDGTGFPKSADDKRKGRLPYCPAVRAPTSPNELLHRIEGYYDAVPRTSTRAEDLGPLTLFVNQGAGWPYYARPRFGHTGPISAADVQRIRDRQRELGVPESLEWVAEVTPGLRQAARRAGLGVHEHPLLALSRPAQWQPVEPPEGVRLQELEPDSPDLAQALAVASIAFSDPGSARGPIGREALAQAVAEYPPAYLAMHADRMRRGLARTVAAVDDGTPVAVGTYQPVEGVAEIVGVATLPAERRRGLAAAVTSRLVDDALHGGASLLFLAASDEAVARVYMRVGFQRIATALIAEPMG
jgi:ribosomal protein S18 acetylase RimI-like enzyme